MGQYEVRCSARHDSSNQVIQHDAESPVDFTIKPADRPWFENVKDSKGQEANGES